MSILGSVLGVLYFLGILNYYMLTKSLLYVTDTDHDDNGVIFHAVVWPWMVVLHLYYTLFLDEDDDDE
jgi:hypothetical protein